ncbi:HipA domain-containing protein [Ralstonia syzygii subsp. celebesensis]|uniref:Toxin HipA n=2 Tax=Ralstonia syzygii subsp. celebesensis TaxID=1310168 RepID=A0A1U9VGV1_9RALS|nr:HipA domain-containing protein [Ralstonia syzygii]AQW29397.1 toxin HipA [blood disease bacterium A2-HR MARDI]QQV56730.1 HipA domain-containing protein [Ralstonia syzygii subsp. celebesensis]CCA79744.1 putative transcription regulator protein (hipA-like) [blood disease bacterium R229]
MDNRALVAFINSDVIGELAERNNIWSFQYSPAWLAHPARFALSPHLPLGPDAIVDGGTDRPVQSYFDNLLPEEGARVLLAQDAGIRTPEDAFALLAYYGAESAGSLTLLPPGRMPDTDEMLVPLSDDVLEARIQALPTVPLSHDAPKKMSLAGAQHKLAVVLKEGALFEPSGHTPSTHLLKPNHQSVDDYPHSVINEWFVMTLAARVGLEVPTVSRRYVPSPVYLIERFDRTLQAGEWKRLHAIDGCQVLNLARVFKYTSWNLESLGKIVDACRASAAARVRVFAWLVFCLTVCNGDSHLKNLSVLVEADGLRLSPHYDLLSDGVYETAGYSGKGRWPALTEFTAPVAGMTRYAEFTRQHVLGAGRALGLAPRTAARLLDALLGTIPTQADALLREVELENTAMLETRPELCATFAGELQCLRAIRHIVIAEMVQRLA